MDRELVIVLDFGGQYNQLIARRVRECNVYCEVHPYTLSLDKIREMNPKGIIFTGGPNSVYGEDSPRCPKEIFEMGIPILGICYGSQLMSYMLGGSVKTAPVSEYGKTEVAVDTESALFKNVSPSTICWMSHTDYIEKAPEKFKITAHTPVCPVAGMENAEKKLYAVQFHPEVMHTQEGTKMLSNFVYDICGCTGDWKMDSFVETTIHQIREKVGVMFGNPETTTGGRALKFYSTVRMDVRRIDTLKNGNDVIGSRTRVKVVKNKVAPPFRQAEFDIMYGKGISHEGCLVDLGADLDIINKSGAWYSYGDIRLGQGKEKVKDFLRENPEIAQEIEAKIRAVTIAKSDNKEAAEEPLQDVESIFKE